MYPFIDLYFIKIPTFGLMVASAFVVCHYLLKKEFKSRNLKEQIIDDIIFYAALSAIIGSKIYFVIEKSFSDSGSFFSNIKNNIYCSECDGFTEHLQSFGSGLTFNGGLICALIFIGIYIYRNKLDFIFLADIITPYILLGHGIGRIGCFLVGDDYGIPSKLPWAVSFENGAPPTTVDIFTSKYSFLGYDKTELSQYLIDGSDTVISVHPTQFYEMFLYFISFIFIVKYLKKYSIKGLSLSFYLILGGFSRFLVEFLRTNERYLLNFSSAQFISIFMIFSGFLILIYIKKKLQYGKN